MFIQAPVTTEVIEKTEDLGPSGRADEKRLILEFDPRNRASHQPLRLKRKVKISWLDERTFEVQARSGLPWPIVDRVTTTTGDSADGAGERGSFTPAMAGLSTQRKVSEVVMRLGVFLCIIAGWGSRTASWLM